MQEREKKRIKNKKKKKKFKLITLQKKTIWRHDHFEIPRPSEQKKKKTQIVHLPAYKNKKKKKYTQY